MRLLLSLFAIPLLAAVPVFELGRLPELLKAHDNQLRSGATIQITGTISEFIEHQGSVVIAFYDKETATAAGCTVNGRMHDLPEMIAGRRYSVEGTLLRWEPQQAGTAILLDHCKVLPDLIELQPRMIYIGVVRAGDREVGFRLRLDEGGEGPFHAQLTPIDSGKFLEDWENRLGLPTQLRLSRGASEWTGSYSRASKTMHLTRDAQQLDLVLQSPASFAGVLTVRKGTQTQARMMAANSSGHLFGFPAQPNPQERRPAVAPAQPRAPRHTPPPVFSIGDAETAAKNWFGQHLELGKPWLVSAKKVDGNWLLVYNALKSESTTKFSLLLRRRAQDDIDIEFVPPQP